MALQSNFNSPASGISVGNAYITVEAMKAKHLDGAKIVIFVYTAADKKPNFIEKFTVSVPSAHAAYATYFDEDVVKLVGNSDTKRAYDYIKSLDGTSLDSVLAQLAGIDFTGSIDV